MAISKGFAARMGLAKNTQTTWANIIANPQAPTDLVTLVSENLADNFERVANEHIYGGAGQLQDVQGVQPISGEIEVQVVYDTKGSTKFWGSDLLLALALGSVSWKSGNGGFNELMIADTLDDLSGVPVAGTASIDKQVSTKPWQYNGIYVNGFTLTGSAREGLRATFPLICYDVDRETATVSAADLAALYAAVAAYLPQPILFSDLTFRIGDLADALAAADQIGIAAFTLTFNRNLSEPTFSTPDYSTGHSAPKLSIEPVVNGLREVTLQITIPRYIADTFYTWRDNDTKLQADLKFSASSGARKFNIYLPTLKVQDISAPVGSAGLVTQTVTLRAFLKDAANTFMTTTNSTAITTEMAIEMQNTINGRTAAIF